MIVVRVVNDIDDIVRIVRIVRFDSLQLQKFVGNGDLTDLRNLSGLAYLTLRTFVTVLGRQPVCMQEAGQDGAPQQSVSSPSRCICAARAMKSSIFVSSTFTDLVKRMHPFPRPKPASNSPCGSIFSASPT